MASASFYEAVVTNGNPDPSLPGHLEVKIPELFGDEPLPFFIPPLVAGAKYGAWTSIPQPIDPIDGSEVRVIVMHMGGSTFRWVGSSQVHESIAENPDTRVGSRSVDGRHTIFLDTILGFFAVVSSDDITQVEQNFINIDPSDNSILLQTSDGTFMTLNSTQIGILNAAGDTLMLDSANGIVLMHQGGVASLNLRSGDVAALSGTVVQISAGTIEMGNGILPPVDPFILSLALLADLSLIAAEIVAIGAGIPAGLPVPAPTAAAFPAKVAASFAVGLPFLSARIYGS